MPQTPSLTAALTAAVISALAAAPAAAAADGPLALSTAALRDPGTNDMVSHHVLVPEGWSTRGGVTWTPSQTRAFVHLDAAVAAPDGREVRFLPNGAFTWAEGPMHEQLLQQQLRPRPGAGELVGGMIWMAPAASPEEFVVRSLVPWCRPEAREVELAGVRELEQVSAEWRRAYAPLLQAQQQTNQMASMAGAGSTVQTELCAPLVRVRYREGGQRFEEEFGLVYVLTTHAVDMGWGGWMRSAEWAVYSVQSLRAPAGRLDAELPLLRTIANSARPTEQWQAMIMALNQRLLRIQQEGQRVTMRELQKTSRMLAQNSDEILSMNRDSWRRQQDTSDRLSRAWSNSMLGVDDYELPDGTTRSLDSSYEHVFTNSLGDFLFTDDANYEPNVGSTREWTRIEPIRPMGGAASR